MSQDKKRSAPSTPSKSTPKKSAKAAAGPTFNLNHALDKVRYLDLSLCIES
jgi:hypothetical protein